MIRVFGLKYSCRVNKQHSENLTTICFPLACIYSPTRADVDHTDSCTHNWQRVSYTVHKTMSSTILVTGGAGYIGSHTVLQLLLGGYKAVVVDNLDNSSDIALTRVKGLAAKHGPNLSFHKVLFFLWDSSFSLSFFFYFSGIMVLAHDLDLGGFLVWWVEYIWLILAYVLFCDGFSLEMGISF